MQVALLSWKAVKAAMHLKLTFVWVCSCLGQKWAGLSNKAARKRRPQWQKGSFCKKKIVKMRARGFDRSSRVVLVFLIVFLGSSFLDSIAYATDAVRAVNLAQGHACAWKSLEMCLREKAVKNARNVIGAPYKHNDGRTQNRWATYDQIKKAGVDCSGLVTWAYNKAWAELCGKDMGYQPIEAPTKWSGVVDQWERQAQREGRPLEKKYVWERENAVGYFKSDYEGKKISLEPGDLIYFLDPPKYEYRHVVMYVGNNMVIHSEYSKKGVIEEPLEDILTRYYRLFSIVGVVRVHPPLKGSITATVLVIDVSGSMAWQWRGGVKIESAKKAALQFIEQVANEPRQPGSSHMIGVVTFSDDASVVCPLTDNYNQAKNTIIRLGTLASTNLGAGLTVALRELDKLPGLAKRFIILLSDGMTNTGLSREQILARPVAEARAKRICIHAVGFGDPGDIDEDFLKKVAQQSGCGTYHYAASGFELFGTYIKIRHAMLGSNRIVEFSSGSSPVRMLPGHTAALGAFQLTAPAQELHYTLAWSELGRMRALLVDPSGRQVTTTYPNTTIYSGNGFMHITVFSPQPGTWTASAAAITSFLSGVQYYGVVSARTGGVVIPISVPPICFTVADQQICMPLPHMPTVLVVLVGVVAAIYILYTRFLAP